MPQPETFKAENLPLWFVVLFSIIAPTWSFANLLKRKYHRTRIIKTLNWFWLGVSVFMFVGLWICTQNDVGLVPRLSSRPVDQSVVENAVLLWVYLLWSRNTEIGFAFLRDAHDKISPLVAASKLKPRDRLALALRSYIELILNFTMLFALCPANSWQESFEPKLVTDVLYFSATTITTSGNGAFVPKGKMLQFLSTYEIYCGLILLVVCFTIYTGLKTSIAPDSGDSE